jgi:uncharacterized protein (TIGR02246 family)
MRERQFGGFQRIGRIQLRTFIRAGVITFFVLCGACSERSRLSADGRNADDANPAIDSLNARIAQAYRDHDPSAYAKLFTDTTVFEWPAINTVRGRPAIEEMVRAGWAPLKDMDLKLIVSSRRLASNHATEFGAFEQSWTDTAGARMTEFGRYVTLLARGDSAWLIDRFFGAEDSVRSAPKRP